ncbi:uncharacterized protein LOC125506488 [Triticum urartu]|uniref:uncharacterized protein LOC125506487 n=1 Tax=Triticum urartu TaxID=4572 RepID=UPI002044C3FF|nr:uncharacterized protein LOC125506487 [Triticum urartu]XP_048527250.1 uncharacterized protein LOC125506488 [Triticum urartu]
MAERQQRATGHGEAVGAYVVVAQRGPPPFRRRAAPPPILPPSCSSTRSFLRGSRSCSPHPARGAGLRRDAAARRLLGDSRAEPGGDDADGVWCGMSKGGWRSPTSMTAWGEKKGGGVTGSTPELETDGRCGSRHGTRDRRRCQRNSSQPAARAPQRPRHLAATARAWHQHAATYSGASRAATPGGVPESPAFSETPAGASGGGDVESRGEGSFRVRHSAEVTY